MTKDEFLDFYDPFTLYCVGLGLGGFLLSFITVFNFLQVNSYTKPGVVLVKNLTTGKHEVHGKIVALKESITPPWHEEESVFYHLRYSELIPGYRTNIGELIIDDVKYVQAGVEDDSGVVEIILHRAENRTARKEKMQDRQPFPKAHDIAAKYDKTLPASCQGIKASGLFPKPLKYRLMESWMPVGTKVYVMGETKMRDGVLVMQTTNEPLVISATPLNKKARPPLAVYKVTLILAVTCFVSLYYLISRMAS